MEIRYKVADELYIVSRLEDVPDEIDHLICVFLDIPPPPHTDEEHEEIEKQREIFIELLGRQRARSN